MAERYRYFDLTAYTEADFAEVQSRLKRDGVLPLRSNELAVTLGAGQVTVATGEAMVQGFWYQNTAPLNLAVAPNGTASARIDWVVLYLFRTSNIMALQIHTGTVGAGAPTLTQSPGGDWEMPLAQLSTTSGVTTMVDARSYSQSVVDGRELALPEQTTFGPELRKFLVYDSPTKVAEYVPSMAANPNGFQNPLLRVSQRNYPGLAAQGISVDLWHFGVNTSIYQYYSPVVNISNAVTGLANQHVHALQRQNANVMPTTAYSMVYYRFEGNDWQLYHGAPLVLSFWAAASKTGQFPIVLQDQAASRSYINMYTLSTTLWTFVWMRFPAPYTAGGTWAFDTAAANYINFVGDCGVSYATGGVGSWNSSSAMAPTGWVSPLNATNDTLYIEIGRAHV